MDNLLYGVVIGYVFVSFWEAFYHKLGGHLGFVSRRTWNRVPFIGGIVLDRYYSHHIVHHFMTFRTKHTKQFNDAEEQQYVERQILNKNKRHVIAQDYGLRVGDGIEYYLYLAPTAPFILLLSFFSGNVVFSIGLIMPLLAMPLMSEYLHPMYHMTKNDACPHNIKILRLFAKTKLFDKIWIYHWLHHKYPAVNFNIMIGAGDYLLGTYRKPTNTEREAAVGELYAVGTRG